MSKGDVVVAYQANEGVVGLARLASGGYRSAETRNYDTFNLRHRQTIWLQNLVPYSVIRILPEVGDEIEFVKIKQGTVFAIERVGFTRILHLIRAFNPGLEGKIDRFLASSNLNSPKMTQMV